MGGGTLTLEGAGSSTVIDFNTGTVPSYACAIYGEYIITPITIKSLKVAVSNTGNRVNFSSLLTFLNANINLDAITFGTNALGNVAYGAQVLALAGSIVTFRGSTFTIDGGWSAGLGAGSQAACIWAEGASQVFFDLSPRVFFTSSSTIDYNYFFTARTLSGIRYWGQSGTGASWSGATATGSRYQLTGNSVLDSLNFTSEQTSLPGDSAGSISSGSQFI